MNIIFCKWNSICEIGMARALSALGNNVIIFDNPIENIDLDTNYLNNLSNFILRQNQKIHYLFSVNFIPIIAKLSKVHKIQYISYTVDSPCLPLYSKELASPYVRAFLFDYNLYEQFKTYAPNNVFYLPLGADTDFYNSINCSPADHKIYDCDVSFVGSYHTDKCIYDKVKDALPEYMQGYISAIINAQMNVYGYYLIPDTLSDEFCTEFQKIADFELLPNYNIDIKSIISDFYIGFKCSQLERIKTLNAVSAVFDLDLYTTEKSSLVPNAHYKGIADSQKMMPKIFQCSKINLNITARTIQNGVAQRIFDIMAAGGFVISNYQSEIPELFIPGEDLILYDSIPDLINKIDYYLSHEDERLRIAENGKKKVNQFYSYNNRLSYIFDSCNHI